MSTTRVTNADVGAGWLTDDHLAPFRSIDGPSERRRVVEPVRGAGNLGGARAAAECLTGVAP